MKRTNGIFGGKLIAIAALVCMVAMFASCNNAADSVSDDDIVGKWLYTAAGVSSGYEFKADKTVAAIAGGTSTPLTGSTWKLEGNTLTINASGATSVTFTVKGNTMTYNGVEYKKQ